MSNAESGVYFHLLIHLIKLYITENKLHAPKQIFQGQKYYLSTQEKKSKSQSLQKVKHSFSQMVLTFYKYGTLNHSLLDKITYAFSCKISGKKKVCHSNKNHWFVGKIPSQGCFTFTAVDASC